LFVPVSQNKLSFLRAHNSNQNDPVKLNFTGSPLLPNNWFS
jgi:hypothetical protein